MDKFIAKVLQYSTNVVYQDFASSFKLDTLLIAWLSERKGVEILELMVFFLGVVNHYVNVINKVIIHCLYKS